VNPRRARAGGPAPPPHPPPPPPPPPPFKALLVFAGCSSNAMLLLQATASPSRASLHSEFELLIDDVAALATRLVKLPLCSGQSILAVHVKSSTKVGGGVGVGQGAQHRVHTMKCPLADDAI
jgi:hypothetical protein